MSTYKTPTVAVSKRSTFGGSRISNGIASVAVWSDGAVIGSAWSAQPELEGGIFGFRGAVYHPVYNRKAWRLETVDGTWVDDFPTRQAVCDAVERIVVLDAFKELNRVEAAR